VASLVNSFAASVPLCSVGYSTISWSEEQLEHALEVISSLGFRGVQLVGWARDRYAGRAGALHGKLNALNLTLVAQSCWGVRLDPAHPVDNTVLVHAYAEFAQSLGGTILQVTDGGKPDGQYSAESLRQLGRQMNALGRMAQQHGLLLGYHPHVGSYGETQPGVEAILGATDPKYVKLVADTGHLVLGGMNPSKIIRKYRERLILMHLKDVRRDAMEAAQRQRASLRELKYLFCEIGNGVLNLSEILQTLREIRFKGWSIVELDGYEPPAGGADEGARVNREGLKRLGWEPGH
jgi:inosose dehydratase